METNDDSNNLKTTKKIKTYAFWLSVLSACALVIVQILSIFQIYVETKTITDIISGVLGVLVVIGIISGPIKTTDNDKTESDEEK